MIPETARSQLALHPRCFAGISLGGANFDPEKMQAMRDWIDAHFEDCIILVPDSVYRLSLQVSHGIEETAASLLACGMADEFMRSQTPFCPAVGDRCRFTVIRSSSIVGRVDFRDYLGQLKLLLENNGPFRTSIGDFCAAFLSRKHGKSPDDPHYSRWQSLSCDFILEELAVAACLVAQGYTVSVYPGTVDIFSEIAAGLHPLLPVQLLGLVNIGIQFKRRHSRVEEVDG